MVRNLFQKTVIKSCFIIAAISITACSTVPLTGRHQLNFINESEMIAMSLTQYDQFLDSNKVSSDRENTLMLQRCGKRISNAVETYMAEQGLSDQLEGFGWEFNLVEDESVNAWCMPGGKVVFYTGILPLTANEEGMAVVMGHEIAHAVARHGSERMSQQMTLQLGSAVASELISSNYQTQQIFMAACGAATQLGVVLPYSRKHEYEADRMGLIFMAMAGYDPHVAVSFWERMSMQGGQKPPQFLSTHPLDENRINRLKQVMPEAMDFYQKYKK